MTDDTTSALPREAQILAFAKKAIATQRDDPNRGPHAQDRLTFAQRVIELEQEKAILIDEVAETAYVTRARIQQLEATLQAIRALPTWDLYGTTWMEERGGEWIKASEIARLLHDGTETP